MFEKYVLDKRLRYIMMTTIQMGEYNQLFIQKKLSLYKNVVKYQDTDTPISESIELIKEQDHTLRIIHNLIIELKIRQGLEGTPHINLAITLITEGQKLLNRLFQIFISQNSVLAKKDIDGYKTYFKSELAIYSEYDKLARECPSQFLREAKNELVEFMHTYNLDDYLKVLLMTLIVYGAIGFIKPEIVQENLKDAKSIIMTLGSIVAVSYVYNLVSKEFRKIKK